MLTVDCRDVEPIKHDLSVYVSDQIGAIPAIKSHEFVLAPIDDHYQIDTTKVIMSIKEFLESIGEQRNFTVIAQQNAVLIRSTSGKPLQKDTARRSEEMYSCPHCGFVTQYEVEYNVHQRMHYM